MSFDEMGAEMAELAAETTEAFKADTAVELNADVSQMADELLETVDA